MFKEKFSNFINWIRNKETFFEKAIPFFVGAYFILICLIYFLSVQTFFSLPSIVIFLIKGANFIFFTLLFTMYLVSTKATINKKIVLILIMVLFLSSIAIILNPSSREITSVARILINNELYSGWTYNSQQQIITVLFKDKIESFLTLITFVVSAFVFLCVFPKAFENNKNKEIVLLIICIAVSSFVAYSIIFERNAIIEIIKSRFNSTKGIKSIFDNKNTFGLICFFGFLSSMSLLFSKHKIPIAIVCLLFSVFGVVITVCKTAIVSLLIYLVLFAILLTIFLFKRKNSALKILSLVVWGGVFLSFLLIFTVPQFRTISNSISKIFIDYGSTTLASRYEAWRTVFQTVNGYNILAGFGDSIYAKYFVASTEAIRFWHITPYFSAHNSFLELYLIGGLFRLILYMYLIYIIFKTIKKEVGLKKCLIVSSFVSFLSCSLFETVILCDHTTLAFIPSLLFVSFIIPSSSNKSINKEKTYKSILFNNMTIKEYGRKNIFNTLTASAAIFCSILCGYFIYYKNYGMFILLLALAITGLVLNLKLFARSNDKKTFVFNYCLSLLNATVILYLIFIFNKNNSFLTGIPFSFEENKYKDVVSVHYLGGFYPFITTLLTTIVLYLGNCMVPKHEKNNIERFYEIKV